MTIGNSPASTGGQPENLQSSQRHADGAPVSAFYDTPINILVVDDDPKNLTVLETVLDNPGYRLVRAESADQALLALVREEFALLILDIRMPDMTGFELAHLIKGRQKTAGVPIIFLTAYYNEDQHVLTGYSAGAVDYLHKPVNPAVLRSKVAVFAELHHKNRALLAEVAERRRAEEQLRELNATLEQRVTERAEALRESEERFRMVADNMSQFAWTADPTGWIFWYNQRWYDYTGTTLEEMQGWGWKKVHHPDHVQRVVVHIQRSWDTGEPWEDTFPLRGKDGAYRWFLSRALPIRDAEGRIVRWFGTNTDITEQRENEEALLKRDRALMAVNDALKKQTSALAETNKELESFSYSISHDMRAPLRTIVAFNHILEEDHSPHLNDDARRCVSIVHKAAVEAGQLIDDLLEFSRLGRQGLTVDAVGMTELAREAIDELKVLQQDRKIDMLVVDVPSCKGDRRLLKLVWANLLENAAKYTKYRQEARIEVGWMPDDASAETVTYYVKDNGVGFDMKYAHKLFGVFQRLHKKEDFDGTGVGLAIVHRIVQRHGGRVWGEGTVDGGATFFFSLRKAKA